MNVAGLMPVLVDMPFLPGLPLQGNTCRWPSEGPCRSPVVVPRLLPEGRDNAGNLYYQSPGTTGAIKSMGVTAVSVIARSDSDEAISEIASLRSQ